MLSASGEAVGGVGIGGGASVGGEGGREAGSGGEEREGSGCSKVSPTESVGLTMVIARRFPNLLRDLETHRGARDRGRSAGLGCHQSASFAEQVACDGGWR